MAIINDQETAQFNDFQRQIDDLNGQIRILFDHQKRILQDVFLRFLQTGKWRIRKAKKDDSSLMRITPVDNNSEQLMVQMLMEALALNWHGEFVVFASGVHVEGRVHDGKLSLYLDAYDTLEADRVQTGLKVLNVDFDFGEMIKDAMREKIDFLTQTIESNTTERDQLLAKLKEME